MEWKTIEYETCKMECECSNWFNSIKFIYNIV
jgi:hypothetical protein